MDFAWLARFDWISLVDSLFEEVEADSVRLRDVSAVRGGHRRYLARRITEARLAV